MRRSEWVLAAYYTYAAVMSVVLPVRWPVPAITIALNLALIAGLAFLAYAHSLRRRELLGVLRDWFPIPLMLLAYREMGWFAPAHHSYALEQSWEAWDKLALNRWGIRAAVEALGPVLPSILEIAYVLVYTVPSFALAMLYVYRRRDATDRFLFQFLLGILICYALFPYFPSEPPRTVFPGQDFPAYNTIFRKLNWWLLGGYGIHTSVFPSAHVAGAFSGAFAMTRLLEKPRWVGRFLMVLAPLIALATFYGRYHYGADALAGFAVSLLALAVAVAVERRCGVRP
jgi:membrane-associated phospholipid phosphatase